MPSPRPSYHSPRDATHLLWCKMGLHNTIHNTYNTHDTHDSEGQWHKEWRTVEDSEGGHWWRTLVDIERKTVGEGGGGEGRGKRGKEKREEGRVQEREGGMKMVYVRI